MSNETKNQPETVKPEHTGADANEHRATQFDGSPNPASASTDTLKPKDDTPAFLEKRSGPKPK